jgi:hypothetical protein
MPRECGESLFATRAPPMPPSTLTSAAEAFWQHTPTAPGSICLAAMMGDLCVLAWARRRALALPTKSAMRRRLRSKASRSMTSAAVSTSAKPCRRQAV